MRTALFTSLAASAILFAGSLSSSASVLVTQNESLPTENVLYSYDGDTSSLNWNGYANSAEGWRDIGQTFKATSDVQLGAFTLKLLSYGVQAQNAAFTITIYETSSANAKFTTGMLVSTQQGFLPSSLEENQYITFTLDEVVNLTANKHYTIFLHFDSTASGTAETWRQVVFARGNVLTADNPLGSGDYHWLRPSPFTDAARAIDAGLTSGNVLAITLHSPAPVPEPGTTALLIGAVTAAGLYRYRSCLGKKTR